MWNAKARQRNSYLHATLNCKHIDPAILNKCVDMALIKKEKERKQKDFNEQQKQNQHLERDCRMDEKHKNLNEKYETPKSDNQTDFRHATSREPDTFGVKVFRKDARIAYGLEGIPKLITEMCSEDLEIQSRALHSLVKELKDPLKCQRAIMEFQIGKRLSETMDSFYPYVPEDQTALEHLVMIIGIVALHHEGANQILNEHQLVSCLYDLIIDDRCVSRYSAKALKIMSSQPQVSDLMASGDHIRRILYVLNRVEIIEDVYLELANLIERSPGKALDEDCFKYLYSKLKYRDQFQGYIMKCFALLINSNEAQGKCDSVDIVHTLYEMLADDTLPLMTLEYTSLAMMNAIYSSPSMWRCREFWDLPLILIKRAHTKVSADMQLWSLQALRQLTVMPSIKNFVRKSCKKRVKNICCLSTAVEQTKIKLLRWIRYKQYAPDLSDDDDIKYSEYEEEEEEGPHDAKSITVNLPEDDEGQQQNQNKPNAMKHVPDDYLYHPHDISYRLDYFPLKKSASLTTSKQATNQ